MVKELLKFITRLASWQIYLIVSFQNTMALSSNIPKINVFLHLTISFSDFKPEITSIYDLSQFSV
jgi:hypothetical protein